MNRLIIAAAILIGIVIPVKANCSMSGKTISYTVSTCDEPCRNKVDPHIYSITLRFNKNKILEYDVGDNGIIYTIGKSTDVISDKAHAAYRRTAHGIVFREFSPSTKNNYYTKYIISASKLRNQIIMSEFSETTNVQTRYKGQIDRKVQLKVSSCSACSVAHYKMNQFTLNPSGGLVGGVVAKLLDSDCTISK